MTTSQKKLRAWQESIEETHVSTQHLKDVLSSKQPIMYNDFVEMKSHLDDMFAVSLKSGKRFLQLVESDFELLNSLKQAKQCAKRFHSAIEQSDDESDESDEEEMLLSVKALYYRKRMQLSRMAFKNVLHKAFDAADADYFLRLRVQTSNEVITEMLQEIHTICRKYVTIQQRTLHIRSVAEKQSMLELKRQILTLKDEFKQQLLCHLRTVKIRFVYSGGDGADDIEISG